MSEPDSLPAAASPAVLSTEPPKPCDRCGTFLREEPILVGSRSVCSACATALRQEQKLYPYGYILALGVLGNFAVGGVLAALCWKRLEDRTRMWTAAAVAGAGVIWLVVLLVFEPVVRLALPLNVVGTFAALGPYKHTWLQHRRAGGARANLLLPVVITIGCMLGVMTLYVLFAMATGQLEEG
jgi:hypothetical protein